MSLIVRSIRPVRAAAQVLAAATFQLLLECCKALSQVWTDRLIGYLAGGKGTKPDSSAG